MKRRLSFVVLCWALCSLTVTSSLSAATVLADRVRETTSTTGTGTYSLLGPVTGFIGFVAGVGNGNVTFYTAEDGLNWEIGIGTVTSGSPSTLSRTTILASSNAGSPVSWAVGVRRIFIAPVVGALVTKDSAGNVGISVSPLARFHSAQASTSTLNELGAIIERNGGSTATAVNRGIGLAFKDLNNATLTGGVVGIRENASVHFGGALGFFTSPPSVSTPSAAFADMGERMRIDSNGNVGIGVVPAATAQRLAVVGADVAAAPLGTSLAAIRVVNTTATSGSEKAEVQFGVIATKPYASISGLLSDSSNNTRGDLVISTRNASSDANLTERMRIDGAGNVTFGGKFTSYNGVATAGGSQGVIAIPGSIALTAQTATIGSTSLYAAAPAGLYELRYYLNTTTAGTAGTVTVTFGWNDGTATQSSVSATVNLNSIAAGTFTQGTLTIKSGAAQNITYLTTVAGATGSPQYALSATVARLQ